MEDVLDTYQQAYDEQRPVVCLDETNRQLIEETRTPRPLQPGQPAISDYEYRRQGVVNLFMLFEPLRGQRQVIVREQRTRQDFAYCLKELAQTYYPQAEKIILVMDNLNTHSLASLYTRYPAEEARQLAKRFEIHHTPKHSSWLNMAEIEIGVLSRQCLNRRIPTKAMMADEVQAWVYSRNKRKTMVHWQFTTADARIKLQHLYPKIETS